MLNKIKFHLKGGAIAVSLLLAVIIALSLNLIGKNSEANLPNPKETIPMQRILSVPVQPAERHSSYEIEWSFIGSVEAARRSDLGFEFGGLVTHLSVDEGDKVVKGAVVAKLNTERLQARRKELKASLKEARASFALFENTLLRTGEAFNLNAVSAQQWDEAQQKFEVQKAVVQRIESQMRTIDLDIRKSELLAPFDGTIASRLVDEGTVVLAGQPIVRLLEMNRPEIRVGIRNDLISRIAHDQEIPVRIDNQELTATVRAILPNRSRETRTVYVLLSLPPAIDGIQEGDLAELTIEDRIAEPGFWLPLSALTESSRGLWSCYVAKPVETDVESDVPIHRLTRRQLELLHQQDDRVYVRGTLLDGELVVAEGLHRLVPNQLVEIIPAPAGGVS